MAKRLVVFVHGWSVHDADTYGRLPERLAIEAPAAGLDLDIQHVFLGKYVSFRDEVRVEDISRAFEAAIRREPDIAAALAAGQRMSVITHSTGGPVVRDWWNRFYASRPDPKNPVPMSHLVMLAPANFGSALAQLGKSALARIASEFKDGVEPGTGVLDWLELGSPESWDLNRAWIASAPPWEAAVPVFPFVLTGQSIDRSLYDHVNSYTDENGSDGVVRVASANLNATYLRLEQEWDAKAGGAAGGATRFRVPTEKEKGKRAVAPRTAIGVLPGRSHSGTKKGIMRSVVKTGPVPDVVREILRCFAVADAKGYEAARQALDDLTAATQRAERLETERELFLFKRHFIHDRTTQLVVRLSDDHGYPLEDFDFLLTACDPANPKEVFRIPSPNLLPSGFFVDRQRNSRHGSTLTYLLDYDVMAGADAVVDDEGKVVRPALDPAKTLGIRIVPRPQPDGKVPPPFVHYLTAELAANVAVFEGFVKPNQTLMLDVVMKRIVHEGVFRLEQGTAGQDFPQPDEFKDTPPGSVLPDEGPKGAAP